MFSLMEVLYSINRPNSSTITIRKYYIILYLQQWSQKMHSQPLPQQQQQQEQLTNLYASIPQSIITTFITTLSQYSLGSDAQIDISTELDEQALNKIVKGMLESTHDQQTIDRVDFDFLVNGKLLRGKIKSHLVRYEISCEQVVEIQYFIAFREFQQMKMSPVEDWVSVLAEVMGVEKNVGVIAALFDGSVAYHHKVTDKKPKITAQLHDGPIKAVKVLPSEQENVYYIITGGVDEELKVSKFTTDTVPVNISSNQHEGSVFAVDVNPTLDGHVCTAGADGCLHVWKIPQNFLSDQTLNQVKTQKKKKRKTTKKQLPNITKHQAHKDSINSLCWLTSSTVATGSSDHCIKLTDIQKMREHRTLLTKDSITTSIDYSLDTLFTSHEDGYIRTWDLRTQGSSPVETFKSHSRFASCVRAHPHSNLFATCSYDQTVKIWDTRSVFPVQTIMTSYDKVFALAWKSESELISAGSNPFLTSHTF